MKKTCSIGRELFYISISIIATFSATLFFLKYVRVPYVWAGAAWFFEILFWCTFPKSHSLKLMVFYLSITILTLTCYEAYLFWGNSNSASAPSLERFEGTYPRGVYVSNDKLLGYRLHADTYVTSKKYYGNDVVYDVAYTIGNDGLRVSPLANSERLMGSVLFFGCSFTFGIGVNDDETLPYQVGRLSKGLYRIYNFGVGGYGPHQMLSAIEHRIVEHLTVGPPLPTVAIYQAIPDHIQRAAGLVFWDKQGPRYILDHKGNVVFSGNFDDGKIPGQITKQLNKSHIYRKIFERQRTINNNDIALFLGIVKNSKELLEKQYHAEFHIIFWDDPHDEFLEKTLEELRRSQFSVHLVSDILPNYKNDPSRYKIARDGHPNANAHKILAQYVIDHILNQSEGTRINAVKD